MPQSAKRAGTERTGESVVLERSGLPTLPAVSDIECRWTTSVANLPIAVIATIEISARYRTSAGLPFRGTDDRLQDGPSSCWSSCPDLKRTLGLLTPKRSFADCVFEYWPFNGKNPLSRLSDSNAAQGVSHECLVWRSQVSTHLKRRCQSNDGFVFPDQNL